jgi:hypothetical protein
VSTVKTAQPSQVDTYHISIADSGATNHYFREKTYFLAYTPVHGKFIMMVNGAFVTFLGMGTANLIIDGIPVKLVNCYHTPDLQASLYALSRHRCTHGCSFLGDHNGMYLTFGRVFTRVHGEIYCCIQLYPLSYHPGIKYALNHTVPLIHAHIPVPLVTSPLNHPAPPIPALSLRCPNTYCVPTPTLTSPPNLGHSA